MYRWLLICLLCLTAAEDEAVAQCATGGAVWLNGENNGIMKDTGMIGGLVIVKSGTVGTMVSGRPLYQIGSSTWKGLTYAALQVWRAYSSIGTNYTYFKLDTPLDSTYIHMRVDNIRGDFLNWESQSVKGYLNGVQVAADFRDPVNGAYNTGNVIYGANYTNTTTQSAMRVFFHSAVDSIVVQQASASDWIIAELMIQCNILLPSAFSRWDAYKTDNGIRLNWKNQSEQLLLGYVVQRSGDGTRFTDIGAYYNITPNTLHSLLDPSPVQGRNYYRLKMIYSTGPEEYSSVLMVRWSGLNKEISIHPNPARDHFIITSLPPDATGVVFSQDGKVVYRFTSGGTKYINCAAWPKGEYVIKIMSGGDNKTLKLIRQ